MCLLCVHREDAIDNRVIALTSLCLLVGFAHWCEHMNQGKENDEKCGALLGGGGVNDEGTPSNTLWPPFSSIFSLCIFKRPCPANCHSLAVRCCCCWSR